MYVNENDILHRVCYYPQFRVTAVGLEMHDPQVRRDYCKNKIMECRVREYEEQTLYSVHNAMFNS